MEQERTRQSPQRSRIARLLISTLYVVVVLLLLVSSLVPGDASLVDLLERPFSVMEVQPIALLLVVALFLPFWQPQLAHLLDRTRRVKFGSAEVDFGQQLEQQQEKLEAVRQTAEAMRNDQVSMRHEVDRAIFSMAASIGPRLETKPRRVDESLAQLPLEIGMLDFVESWILSELIYWQLRDRGVPVAPPRRKDTSLMTFLDLRSGKIDLNAGYSGTGMMLAGMTALPHDEESGRDALNGVYGAWGLTWLDCLGFENREKLMMLSTRADDLGIVNTTDLKRHASELTFGANHEYFLRDWSFPSLQRRRFRFQETTNEVALNDRYSGLLEGRFDIGVAWTTDPELRDRRFRMIEPDPSFPGIDQFAMPVCRADIAVEIAPHLAPLRLTVEEIQELNARARSEGTGQSTIRGFVGDFFENRGRKSR